MTLMNVQNEDSFKLFDLKEIPDDVMYILSNDNKHFGAITIVYQGVLERIAELVKGDYYVLPSSVHEVIIVPANCSPKVNELNEMIQEINQTQVKKEEVLSDHSYFYNVELGTLLCSR